jgi:transcriptional regulator with XRE-family HTH domain
VNQLYVLLGRQIAHFRHRAGLTQEELAEKTNYSVDFIGLVERGINAPTVKRLKDIAEVLAVEVWQLFKPSNRTDASVRTNRPRKTSRHHAPKAGS